MNYVVSVVVLTVRDYTNNAFTDEIKKQLGENFEVVYYEDTLQMEITTKNKELFKIYTDRELVDGVLMHNPYDIDHPKTCRAVIRNYEPHYADKLTSGIVGLRRFTNIDLTRDSLSKFTVIRVEVKRI